LNLNDEVVEFPVEEGATYYFGNDKPLYDSIFHSTVPIELHEKVKSNILGSHLIRPDNDQLAGDIKQEYLLFLKNKNLKGYEFLNINIDIADIICDFVQSKLNKSKINGIVTSLWINFQKPCEFNPLHSHDADYSFIWYLDIPEIIRKEHLSGLGNARCRGLVEFLNKISGIATLINPKSRDLLIFNALKKHCVYPFYSDAVRISMAGNIREIK